MSIYENTRQMKELLTQVLSNDTQEIQENHLSSFATPKLYEKPLMESEDDAASIRRSSPQRQARWVAQDIGHRQDTNRKNNLFDNSNANEYKQAVKRAKAGETY